MIPNDPVMLLSYTNTQLRDNYKDLEDLCDRLDVSQSEIEEKLERRLGELISRIDGVGEVSVMVTLEKTTTAVYEKDSKLEETSGNAAGSSSRETEVVLAGSAKQPLLTGNIMPTVRGAAVVCEAAANPLVREKVANTVAKALNIGISRVYVTD